MIIKSVTFMEIHGQVASMVVTTLKLNDPMPNDAEIKAMITDPMGWLMIIKSVTFMEIIALEVT